MYHFSHLFVIFANQILRLELTRSTKRPFAKKLRVTSLILFVISDLFFQEFPYFFDVLQGLVTEVGIV